MSAFSYQRSQSSETELDASVIDKDAGYSSIADASVRLAGPSRSHRRLVTACHLTLEDHNVRPYVAANITVKSCI